MRKEIPGAFSRRINLSRPFWIHLLQISKMTIYTSCSIESIISSTSISRTRRDTNRGRTEGRRMQTFSSDRTRKRESSSAPPSERALHNANPSWLLVDWKAAISISSPPHCVELHTCNRGTLHFFCSQGRECNGSWSTGGEIMQCIYGTRDRSVQKKEEN